MDKPHHLIVVPGLSGTSKALQFILSTWKSDNFIPHIHDVGWKNGNEYKPKLDRLNQLIDDLYKSNSLISLLGTSAGGSTVLNAFCARKTKVHRVINVCGRLRTGKDVYPTLETASKSSPAFKESVLLCENNEKELELQDRAKILTIRSFYDEVVPLSTMTLNGGTNKQIFTAEHMISISIAMTFYRGFLMRFLTQ
jgi:hypothetical protein